MAWLSRMESAFELHFSLLEGIPSHRLLRVAVQLLDDSPKTHVCHHVDVQTMSWESFKRELCKHFRLNERQVKNVLCRCR